MKNFKQQSVSIPSEHYVSDDVFESPKDTFLFRLLKGMKLQERENLNLKDWDMKKYTEPLILTTIAFSNQLIDELRYRAFRQQINTGDFINICLELAVSPKVQDLSDEQIVEIINQIHEINNMVAPYIQKDLAKIHFAVQMAMKYPED
jgi:hypothetical protein